MSKNENETKEYSRTFLLLFYWGKISGIVTFKLSKSRPLQRSYPSIIYVIFLLTIYAYVSYKIAIARGAPILGETPLSLIMDYIAIIIGLLEVLFGWSLFVIEKNRVQSIITSLSTISEIQWRLKMKVDYEKNYLRLAISLTILNCLCVIRNCSWILLTHCNDINFFIYALISIISFNIEILFIWIVFVARETFKRLNEKIKKSTNHSVGQVSKSASETSVKIEGDSSCLLAQQIVTISCLHREIRKAIRLTGNHFAPLLFFNRLKYLCRFTTCVHVTYRYLKNCECFTYEDFIYILHASVWIVTLVIFMSIFSEICGSTAEEANNTGNLLHAFINNCQIINNNKAISQLNIFLLDLLQNNVTISLLGFVEANYFLVYSTIATVAGSLVIMLQFYD